MSQKLSQLKLIRRYDRTRAFLSKSDEDLRYFVYGAPQGFYSTHPIFPMKKRSTWPAKETIPESDQKNYVFETGKLGQFYYLGDFIVAEPDNSDAASSKGSSIRVLKLKRDKRRVNDFMSFAKLNMEKVTLPKLTPTPIQKIKTGNPGCGYSTAVNLMLTNARSQMNIPRGHGENKEWGG
jgi:hypothetical protein